MILIILFYSLLLMMYPLHLKDNLNFEIFWLPFKSNPINSIQIKKLEFKQSNCYTFVIEFKFKVNNL